MSRASPARPGRKKLLQRAHTWPQSRDDEPATWNALSKNPPSPQFLTVLRSPGAAVFCFLKESCFWPYVLYSDFLKSSFFWKAYSEKRHSVDLGKGRLGVHVPDRFSSKPGTVLAHTDIQVKVPGVSWPVRKAPTELVGSPKVRQQRFLGL